MTRFLTFILLIGSFFYNSFSISASDYLRYVERAEKAIAEQQWDKAATYLVEAMRAEPANGANVMLLSNLGMLRFYAGKDSLALMSLTQAHEMAPESITILTNRARVLRQMHRDREAAEDLTLILLRDTTNTDALLNRGTIALQLGDSATARHDFDRLESLMPDDPHTWLARSMYLTDQGRYAEALPYYDRLLLKEQDADIYAARANCHMALGQLTEAADDIALGLELQPDDPELYYARATLNSLRHRPDDARTDALRARQLGVSPQLLEPFLK